MFSTLDSGRPVERFHMGLPIASVIFLFTVRVVSSSRDGVPLPRHCSGSLGTLVSVDIDSRRGGQSES